MLTNSRLKPITRTQIYHCKANHSIYTNRLRVRARISQSRYVTDYSLFRSINTIPKKLNLVVLKKLML